MVFSIDSNALALIGAALFLNVLITALYYMGSRALSSPSLIAASKEHITQLFFSGFIIFIFLASNGILSSLTGGIICYGTSIDCSNIDHIKVAMYALDNLMNTFVNLYSKLYLFEVIIAVMSSTSFTLGIFRIFLFVFSIHISPFVALTMIANVQVTLVEAVGYSVGLILAKKLVLEMILYAVPTIFLPMGLFFRALPQLRVTGSTILALCFTLFFIFPIALIFTNYVIYDFYEATSVYITFDTPTPISEICNEDDVLSIDMDHIQENFEVGEDAIASAEDPNIFYKIGAIIWGVVEGLASIISLIWDLIKLIVQGGNILSLLNPLAYLKAYYYYMIIELLAASQFLVIILTTTILEFVIVVTAHRSVSAVIGGETEIFGLSKIV
ncbi:MAG: hypothetical protein PHU63_01515 [Candidatus ainarchaeum sp.]|nr:hypothetical protein [Candidatus ainarchaeum sp.]